MVKKEAPQYSVEFLYSQIRPDVRKSFTREQEEEVKRMLKNFVFSPSQKLVDARFSFWCLRRLYFVVFLGVDRRRETRRHETTISNRFFSVFLKTATYAGLLLLFISMQFLGLLILKNIFGIDLFPFTDGLKRWL